MLGCEYNVGESRPLGEDGYSWSHQLCGETPATRIWDERRWLYRFYCDEHLEELRQFYLIQAEEIMVMREKKK